MWPRALHSATAAVGRELGGEFVFVQESAEPIASANARLVGRGGDRDRFRERRLLAECAVRAWATYSCSTRSRCACETIRIRSRHSRRTLPTQRSACAFAFGAAIGVRITVIASERRKASKALVSL